MKKSQPLHQNKEFNWDDVIEMIERMKLDGNVTPSQLVEQPRPL
jgi:hypothetical protein